MTATAVATIEPKRSLIADMAGRYNMEAKAFADTLRGTVVPKNATNEEFAAFLMVAREYNLNPITKEIFAFPKQGGGIQPIVSVDGWANLINSNPQCDGVEFLDNLNDKGDLVSITCQIYRKDRSRPTTATEYMAECKRDTSTWKQWPRRMLRHKAMIQAARYAFGFAGIVDQDEAERLPETVAMLAPPPAPPPSPKAKAVILAAVEGAEASKAGDHWTGYLEMQKAELAAAQTAHDKQVISETIGSSAARKPASISPKVCPKVMVAFRLDWPSLKTGNHTSYGPVTSGSAPDAARKLSAVLLDSQFPNTTKQTSHITPNRLAATNTKSTIVEG